MAIFLKVGIASDPTLAQQIGGFGWTTKRRKFLCQVLCGCENLFVCGDGVNGRQELSAHHVVRAQA